MKIFDAQVHTWLGQHEPKFPWDADQVKGPFESMPVHPAECVIADMDREAVDVAALVVPTLYGTDNRYAIEAATTFPGRFGVVGRIDTRLPNHRRRLQTLMAEPTMIAIRLTDQSASGWSAGGELAQMIEAADELDVPVCARPGPSNLKVLTEVARRHPSLRLVVDHLGLEAPPISVPVAGPDPFRLLPELLALARFPNIYVKMSGAPALSNTRYPFNDIWPALRQVVTRFGPDRVMWGSDYNRTKDLHTYREAIDYINAVEGFDAKTIKCLYSETFCKVFGW